MNNQLNTLDLLGMRIAHFRKLKGYTQESLAEELDVSTRSVRAWEGEEYLPGLIRLVQICNILGIEISSLICDSAE